MSSLFETRAEIHRKRLAEDLEKWIKEKRNEGTPHTLTWYTMDALLNEVREKAAMGLLPWEEVPDAKATE